MTSVVRRNPKLLAFLLLAAISAVSAAGQDPSWMTAAQAQARPAPCHHQGPATPHPEPVSYRCCQSGHNFATPQGVLDSSLYFVNVTLRGEFPNALIVNSSRQRLLELPIASTDPPDITPLRV